MKYIDWASLLKGLAIIVTAAAGLFGTLFKLRHNGKLTLHGRIAAFVILVGAVLALAIHANDSASAMKAAKALDIQIAREQETFRNVVNANSLLLSTMHNLNVVKERQEETTRTMNLSIQQQRRGVESIEGAVAAAAERTRDTLKSVDADIARAQQIVRRGVARLSRPLGRISFSYRLVFEEADKTFPAYYARVATLIARPDEPTLTGVRLDAAGHSAIVYDNSEVFPTLADGRAAFDNLASDISTIHIEDEVDLPTIRGFHSYGVRLVPSERVRLRPDSQRSYIVLTVDVQQRRIVKDVMVRSDSFTKITDSGVFQSELDLLDSEHPESIVVYFWEQQIDPEHQPSLVRLQLSLGENELAIIFAEKFNQDDNTSGKSFSFRLSEAVKSAVYP